MTNTSSILPHPTVNPSSLTRNLEALRSRYHQSKAVRNALVRTACETNTDFAHLPLGIFKPNVSQTIFAYNLDVNQIWYDMSDIFGDGFAGSTMTLKPTDSTCESIVWAYGKPPAGSQVKNCGAETDLELTFCTNQCLPSWSPCGRNAPPGETRTCCTHCIGDHHCVAAPN